jgi:hypothetical protein
VRSGGRRAAAEAVIALTGMGFHDAGNLTDAGPDGPAASTASLLWDALFGGSPLLAPGFLALVAAVGLIAVARWDGSPSAHETFTVR